MEVDSGSCFVVLIMQTKEPKQGQGRGRKGHDVEVEHEEDEATASEQQQQPIEKLSEECSGEWDTHVPEQAVIVVSNTKYVLGSLHCFSMDGSLNF